MALSVIDKFLYSKKKKIFSYCKRLNKLVGLKTNSFESMEEFNSIISFTTDYYVDNYLLDCSFDIKNIESYYKYTNDNNTYFNIAYFSIIKYYEVNNRKISSKTYDLRTFYLIVLLGFALHIDKTLNKLECDKNKCKSLLNGFINIMNTDNFIINKKYKAYCNEFVSEMLSNAEGEKLFFKSLVIPNAKNTYEVFDINKKYFMVKFDYKINGLDKFSINDINRFVDHKHINSNYTLVSYELCATKILDTLINGGVVNDFLFYISREFYTGRYNFTKLNKVCSSKNIKKHIKIYVKFNEFKDNINIFNDIIGYGYDLVVDFEDDIIDASIPCTFAISNKVKEANDKVIIRKEKIKEEIL
ncbi:MAG: hypothetical protein RSD96_01155 [Bacilli bacterium]